MKTAVVFGLSGVGKSWLTARLAQAMNYRHVSASTILRLAKERETKNPITSEHLRRGKVLDNQALLVAEFRQLRANETRPILLDGHNIVDQGESVREIPLSVIQGLAPDGIIFVFASPGGIRERRLNDLTRERPDRSDEQLEMQQLRAIELAEEHGRALNIPIMRIEAGDEVGFRSAVVEIFGQTTLYT